MESIEPRTYLGDGVYAAHNGVTVTLTQASADGLRVAAAIVLERDVVDALMSWLARLPACNGGL